MTSPPSICKHIDAATRDRLLEAARNMMLAQREENWNAATTHETDFDRVFLESQGITDQNSSRLIHQWRMNEEIIINEYDRLRVELASEIRKELEATNQPPSK